MPEPAAHPSTGSESPSDLRSAPGLSRSREPFLLGLILLAFFALGFESLIQKSVTVDEFAHLPAGLSYWRTGDFRIYSHGSPLIHLWTTLPLLGRQVALPLDQGWNNRNQWQFGYEFMFANANSYQAIFIQARMMNLVLGALLVTLIWGWARSLYGPAAGLAAALLAAFNPNLMAHSTLVTNDVGVSLTTLLAVFAFAAFCREPSWPRTLGAGVGLGLALLSKFTALLLVPLLPALAIGYRLAGGTRRPWRRTAFQIAVIFFLAWLTLGSGYLWRGFGAPLRAYSFQSELFRRTASLLPPGLRVPLPFDCVQGMDFLSLANQEKNQGYLWGKRDEGSPVYNPVGFLVKTPVACLILIALGIGSLGLSRTRLRRDEIFILLPPLVIFLFISFYSNLNTGIRYLLPVFPFLFILASRPWARWFRPPVWAKAGLILLLAGNLASNLLVYPDYLAYFNFAVGGPSQGHRVLIHSNLDWGQDLIGLKGYLDQEKLDQICLAYFGRVDPKIYGIRSRLPLPGRNCERIALSVNLLMGMQDLVLDDSRLVWSKPGQFAWLQKEKPVAIIGHSIWIFKLQSPTVPPEPTPSQKIP